MKKRLYPEVPEDLASLSPDELTQLRQQFIDQIAKVVARDESVLADLSMSEVRDANAYAKDAVAKLDTEIAARAALEQDFETELAELAETVGVKAEAGDGDDDDGGDEDGDGDEGDAGDGDDADAEASAEVVAEAATAEAAEATDKAAVTAAGSMRAAKPRPPAPPKGFEPVAEPQDDGAPFRLMASGEAQPHGAAIDKKLLEEVVLSQWHDIDKGTDKVLLARAEYGDRFPKERRIEDIASAREVVMEAASPEAILASGGLCAPVTPYYELQMLSQASRPVRDALASFNAVRGGLQFARPPIITDPAAGIGAKTAAQDSLGGTNATKNKVAVTCPSFSTVNLEMIYRILQFGNLNARAFPELITTWMELALAYHARFAESALLDYIDTSSTATTQGKVYGTASTVIDSVLYAAAGMRSRHRMNPDYRFRALLPQWLKGAIAADIVNTQFQRFDVKPDNVEALLSSYGVEPVWYQDTHTGGGQVFGTQSAGGLLAFPTSAIYYVFPEGAFLFLDGGTLDLGIVRDSTLNATNDFQNFAETFEAAAFVGIESLKITATICNDGTVANPATAITC